MSKQNNANWDHYKLAGRERPGDAAPHNEERRRFAGAQAHAHDTDAKEPHIPNQERESQPRAEKADAAAGERRGSSDSQPDSSTPADDDLVLGDDEGYTG